MSGLIISDNCTARYIDLTRPQDEDGYEGEDKLNTETEQCQLRA